MKLTLILLAAICFGGCEARPPTQSSQPDDSDSQASDPAASIPETDRQLVTQLPATNYLFPIKSERLFGAIDVNGTVVVPPRYYGASRGFPTPFFMHAQFVGQEGILLLSEEEWLYVGRDGAKSIKPLDDHPMYVVNLGDSLFVVHLSASRQGQAKPGRDEMGVVPARAYDPTGRWNPPPGIVPRSLLREGLLPVSGGSSGKCGYADRTGTLVVEPKYDICSPFCEGLAAVKAGDRWGFIDTTGQTVIPLKFSMVGWFDKGIARVVEPGKDVSYFIDKDGEYLFDWPIPAYTPEWNIYGYQNGLLVHQDTESGLFGYIDPKGKWIIEPTFEKAHGFEEGRAMVVTKRGQYFIDATGQIQFKAPPLSGTSSHFTYGLAGDSSGTAYVNRSGECVWRAE